MHSDQPYFSNKPLLSFLMKNAPIPPPVFNGTILPPGRTPLNLPPFNNFDIQPCNTCPKNFFIFDQTNNRIKIMYHPELSSKIFYPGFGVDAPIIQNNVNANDTSKISSPLKENSADIDALLSTEDEESDDEVSTARMGAIYECDSSDSCSNYESVSSKSRSNFKGSFGKRSKDKKHNKMRNIMKVLRGIVPGANQMSTVAVLDGAVRYLKSLSVEVKKMGVGNLKE